MPALTEPTYTEYPPQSFTAGTLSDLEACVDYIESHLQRGTLGAQTTPTRTQVEEELARAKQELLHFYPFTFSRKYMYCTTTADVYRYALPADYNGGRVSIRDVTNDLKLRFYTPYQYDLKYPDMSEESSGSPIACTVKGRELWMYPPTSANITLEFEYSRSGDDTSATDISYLPEMYRYLVCDRVLSLMFRILQKYDVAKLYEGDWEKMLGFSKRSNNRKKWAGAGYQALSWQQVYRARYNQQ